MIFATRGLLVSLAFFATVYCPLSLLVALAWRGMRRMGVEPTANLVDFLFGLRLFPFAFSAGITLLFTLPSFWLLERASLDEDAATFTLAGCSLVILAAGMVRVLRTQRRTTRAVSQWRRATSGIGADQSTPVLSASMGAPALFLVGIRRPLVMVSDRATTVLNDKELQVAVRHELAHMRSRDNLKKVLVSATPLPGMNSLETAWLEAAELAADDAAVANRQEALDLASALIKLSRSCQPWTGPMLASCLIRGTSSIGARVVRLLEWREANQRCRRARLWILLALLPMVAGTAFNYGATLALTHRLTELLVP